jgi:hypothetical protein
MAAKRVLVRRGLLDITHGLRLPSLPGAPPPDHNGSSPAAGTSLHPLDSDGHDRQARPADLPDPAWTSRSATARACPNG